MHHIYETNAFILKNTPQGEADSMLTLFTEELGLVRAMAQGIRYEKSKLRFGTQNLSMCHVSLVRGKGMWRLTNSAPLESNFSQLNPEAVAVVAKIFRLLERLVAGETGDNKLFSIIHSGILFLKENQNKENFNSESVSDIEAVIVLRILNRLGYIGSSEKINFYILNDMWDGEVIEKMKEERREALKAINSGIRESQL
jgi:DNA repair protein RecO